MGLYILVSHRFGVYWTAKIASTPYDLPYIKCAWSLHVPCLLWRAEQLSSIWVAEIVAMIKWTKFFFSHRSPRVFVVAWVVYTTIMFQHNVTKPHWESMADKWHAGFHGGIPRSEMLHPLHRTARDMIFREVCYRFIILLYLFVCMYKWLVIGYAMGIARLVIGYTWYFLLMHSR